MDQAAVDAMTASVDFTTVVVGIAAVGAAMAIVKVAKVGVSMMLSAISNR